MKKTMLFRLAALVLVCALLTPTFAAAAAPEQVMPCASEYIMATDCYITPRGAGLIEIWFYIRATDVMDDLGAYQVVLCESSDKVSWTEVTTIYQRDVPSMYDHNDYVYRTYVTYRGLPGKYYTARVYFRAVLNGNLSAVATWTPEVQAT